MTEKMSRFSGIKTSRWIRFSVASLLLVGFTIWSDAEEPTDNNPIGWVYLWSESGIKGSGRWWRWDDWSTLKDMANGKMITFISEILDNIKEQEAFKRISESLEKK